MIDRARSRLQRKEYEDTFLLSLSNHLIVFGKELFLASSSLGLFREYDCELLNGIWKTRVRGPEEGRLSSYL